MRQTQTGIAMIEVLIAVLIFSLGILGIVGLLGTSMKHAAAAGYRNQASMLANQVVGEMWTGQKTSSALTSLFASPEGTQYLSWRNRVAASLPGVTATSLAPTVTIDGDMVTVTVRWQAPGETAAHQHVLVARINE